MSFLHPLLKVIFVVWGLAFLIIGSGATIRGLLATHQLRQRERIWRAVLVCSGVAMLAPGMTLLAYGFSSDQILVKTLLTICLTSVCFSPVGLLVVLGAYYRLWGWTKLREDIQFLSRRAR